MIRRRMPLTAELALVVFGMGFAVRAQQPTGQDAGQTLPSRDPNMPDLAGGFIKLAPNPPGWELLAYAWTQGDDYPPAINMSWQKGTRNLAMSYFGYNDDGSYLMADGIVYALKGNNLRKTDLRLDQLPRNMRNASPSYYSFTGIDPDKAQAASTSPADKGAKAPRQDASGTMSPSAAGRRAPRSGEEAGVPMGGRDARIVREASAVTLIYKDADGEHRYKVQRPSMGLPAAAAQQLNATDTGGWIYIAPDGASGILFNVNGDHSVTATKLPAQALGMLVRR